MKKRYSLMLFLAFLLLFSGLGAQAAGADYSGIATAVDFGTVVTAVISVGALLAVAYVAVRGVKFVLAAIGR